MSRFLPTFERFLSHLSFSKGIDCWIWRGLLFQSGYGQFYSEGKTWRAHRWSYTYFVGLIPDGLCLDHLCRNTLCVNPDHLEPVTTRVNIRRGLSGKTNNNRSRVKHCPQGHPYDEENTYTYIRNGGQGNLTRTRYCRACHKERSREHPVGTLWGNAAKTHCKHGHPLSGGNLYLSSRGQRGCRICRQETSARHYKKARQAAFEKQAPTTAVFR
ncbi:MAG: HNH endonuclease [Candidatus Liptonbacteria bacterium]|nr:HNH endonuclease [Candidatus Liptonbacteria bacterium]